MAPNRIQQKQTEQMKKVIQKGHIPVYWLCMKEHSCSFRLSAFSSPQLFTAGIRAEGAPQGDKVITVLVSQAFQVMEVKGSIRKTCTFGKCPALKHKGNKIFTVHTIKYQNRCQKRLQNLHPYRYTQNQPGQVLQQPDLTLELALLWVERLD